MAYTVSIHGGTKLSLAHNRRLIPDEPHVLYELSDSNIVLERHDRPELYKRVFTQAIEEYNSKQSRRDRELDIYDGEGKVDGHKIISWARSTNAKEREFLFSFGNMHDGHNPQEKTELLLELFKDWKKRNPNLIVMDAVIHLDEVGRQPHLHVVFIPVAKTSRGVGLKMSLNAALAEQAGKTYDRTKKKRHENPLFVEWRDKELEMAKDILAKRGLEFIEGDKRKEHLPTKEYKKRMTDLNRLNKILAATSKELDTKKQELERVLDEVESIKNESVQLKEELFKKRFFSEDMDYFYRLYEKGQKVFGDEFYAFRLDIKRIVDGLFDGYQDTVSVIRDLADTAISWIRYLKNEKNPERAGNDIDR